MGASFPEEGQNLHVARTVAAQDGDEGAVVAADLCLDVDFDGNSSPDSCDAWSDLWSLGVEDLLDQVQELLSLTDISFPVCL